MAIGQYMCDGLEGGVVVGVVQFLGGAGAGAGVGAGGGGGRGRPPLLPHVEGAPHWGQLVASQQVGGVLACHVVLTSSSVWNLEPQAGQGKSLCSVSQCCSRHELDTFSLHLEQEKGSRMKEIGD